MDVIWGQRKLALCAEFLCERVGMIPFIPGRGEYMKFEKFPSPY